MTLKERKGGKRSPREYSGSTSATPSKKIAVLLYGKSSAARVRRKKEREKKIKEEKKNS